MQGVCIIGGYMAEEHINIDDSKVDEITRAYIIPAIVARETTNPDESAIHTMMRLIGTSINTSIKYGRTDASYFVHKGLEPYVNTVIAALKRQGYCASLRTTTDCPSGIIDIKW